MSTGYKGRHPTVTVRHRSGAIIDDIDEQIAPVCEALWRIGIDTSGSCQGDPTGSRPYDTLAIVCFDDPWFSRWSDAWYMAHDEADDMPDGLYGWAVARARSLSGGTRLLKLLEMIGALDTTKGIETGTSPDEEFHADTLPTWLWSWGGDTLYSALQLPNEDLPVLLHWLGRIEAMKRRTAVERAGQMRLPRILSLRQLATSFR